jgi:hypothetical protein
MTEREPRRRTAVPREEAMAAFATAPRIDADRFRHDLDSNIDSDLDSREW